MKQRRERREKQAKNCEQELRQNKILPSFKQIKLQNI
jgi:hypothetical protein